MSLKYVELNNIRNLLILEKIKYKNEDIRLGFEKSIKIIEDEIDDRIEPQFLITNKIKE